MYSLRRSTADLPRPFKIHRSSTELSAGRAAVSHAIPSAGRTAIQNWWALPRNFVRFLRLSQSSFVPLVKPDATPDEVAAVVQSDQGTGGQIFAQAVRPTSPRAVCSLSESCSLHPPHVMESPVRHIAKFKNGMKTYERLNARSPSWPNCSMM